MEKFYSLKRIPLLIVILFSFTISSKANWIKTENKNSLASQEVSDQSNAESNKSDSLPAGVTKDWLNSLRDESGNRIIP
ncbi:MAG: hypothetical protein ABI462_13740, partial [Ignavibacteria bacterium]